MADRTAPQPDSEGWIEWAGSEEPPLLDSDEVECRTRGAQIFVDVVEVLYWGHHGDEHDIIAYRPVSPAQEVEPSAPVARLIEDLRVARTDDFIARITALEAEKAALDAENAGLKTAVSHANAQVVAELAVTQRYADEAMRLEAENTELKRRLEDVPARMEAARADAASKAQEIYILATTARDALKAENAALREREQKLVHAINLGLEYWAHRQQRYKNRHPVWVVNARALLQGQEPAAAGTVGDGR